VRDDDNGSGVIRDVHIRDGACKEALYKFSPTYVALLVDTGGTKLI
jgi:hypothetical protein